MEPLNRNVRPNVYLSYKGWGKPRFMNLQLLSPGFCASDILYPKFPADPT